MSMNTASRRDLLRAASTALAYSAGAAIVTGGMALASEAKSETPASEGPSDEYHKGFLDGCQEVRLALAWEWLRRWTGKGGSLFRHPDGSFLVGWPEYDLSPVYDTDAARFSGAVPEHAFAMLRDQYDGAMRELIAVKDETPGLRRALREIVSATPALGFPKHREA